MYPAIERAKAQFLKRGCRGQASAWRSSGSTATFGSNLMRLSSSTPPETFQAGEHQWASLGECLDRDLQGLHAATTNSLVEVEAMFGELMSMMNAPPHASAALSWHSVPVETSIEPPAIPTDETIEKIVLVHDKATSAPSLPTETKATQTAQQEPAGNPGEHVMPTNVQLSLEACLSRCMRRNKLSELGKRMSLRRVLVAWRYAQQRRAWWTQRAASFVVPGYLEEDAVWMHEVRARDGKYGLAKAVHGRGMCRRVFLRWIQLMAGTDNSNDDQLKHGGDDARIAMDTTEASHSADEEQVHGIVATAEDASSTTEQTPKMGKTQLRRLKREQIWTSVKERKRKKKEEMKALRPVVEQPVLDMSDAAVLMRKERAILKRESFLMRANEGATIVIDCGFEEDMTSREKKSLSQQIMFSYGVNKRSDSPATMFVTSLRGETEANLTKIGGFGTWLGCSATPKSYLDVFKKESLVYLTADSPNVITDLDKDKVYIIGGIVDRNRLKGATFDKAVAQGIQTAKLPLDKVLEMGQATRVLTVNHVFQILVDYTAVRDWTQATLSALPGRKGAQPKGAE